MTASVSNYVYLDTSSSCAPASNTAGFTSTAIPIAVVLTGASSITSVTDLRTWFASLPSASVSQPSVVRADFMNGADFSVKVNACIAAVIAAGGGTCDARGFPASNAMSENIVVGNGSTPVNLILPAGTITRGTVSGTGLSAQILYNSNATIVASSPGATTIAGPSDVTAVQQAFNSNGVINAHLSGFNISDTGTAISGSSALMVGGPNPGGMPDIPPNDVTYSNNAIGTAAGTSAYFPGQLAEIAIYTTALSAARIIAHWTAGDTAGNGYRSSVETDNPIAFWPLTDASGTTATELISGRNGTYSGGVTLGSASGIPGDATSGAYAASFNGTSGYVSLPSYTWFTGGDFTIEGWGNTTTAPGLVKEILAFVDSTGANLVRVWDWGDNGGFTLWTMNSALGTNVKVAQGQMALPEGSWSYFAITYHNGAVLIYQNGSLVAIGTDVGTSTLDNISVSGADIGVVMNGQHGCICYNKFYNVSAGGQSFGVQTLNNSGYLGSVNSNQWYGGNLWAPIGLYDEGGGKNTWYNPDFEGNSSKNGGGVLAAQPTNQNAGSNYVVGDIVTPTAGCTTNPTLKVQYTLAGGAVRGPFSSSGPSLAVATPGSGCPTQESSVSVTGGSGTNLKVNLQTSAYMVLLGDGDLVANPYEEAGSVDYICGTDNEVTGPMGSANGSIYSPLICPGTTTGYGGPGSDFMWGPGAVPPSIGAGNYITFGLGTMYDPGPISGQGGYDLYRNGPVFAGTSISIYGNTGHSDWAEGLDQPLSGITSTGKVTVSQLSNPSAPTVTVGAGSGSTGYTYALVCQDANGGSTLTGTFSSSVNGPSALGAWLTAAVVSGGAGGYVVGDHPYIVGGDGTGQVTVTAVDSSGHPTALSIYLPGSKYQTIAAFGSAVIQPFATTGGSGSGLTITGTTSYMSVAYSLQDGCRRWTVLRNNSTSSVNLNSGTGWNNLSTGIFDFGATTAVVAPTRNTTGDESVAGTLTTTGQATLGGTSIPTSSTLPITVATGSTSMGTSQINSGSCASPVSVTAANVVATDVIEASFNGNPTGVVGYQASTNGMLAIIPYPGSGSVNFVVCNNTNFNITPGVVTLNWRVTR